MTNHIPGMYASAEDFLESRRDWLEVHTLEVEPGAFDVVLKIDGTYFDRDTAREVAESFAADLRHLLARIGKADQ
ncbi:hypothetical protein ACWEQD_14360 [Rhodococcus pyridinivorans]